MGVLYRRNRGHQESKRCQNQHIVIILRELGEPELGPRSTEVRFYNPIVCLSARRDNRSDSRFAGVDINTLLSFANRDRC